MSTEVRFPVYFFAHVYIFFTCIYLLVLFLLLIFKRFVGILHFRCLRSATFLCIKGILTLILTLKERAEALAQIISPLCFLEVGFIPTQGSESSCELPHRNSVAPAGLCRLADEPEEGGTRATTAGRAASVESVHADLARLKQACRLSAHLLTRIFWVFCLTVLYGAWKYGTRGTDHD